MEENNGIVREETARQLLGALQNIMSVLPNLPNTTNVLPVNTSRPTSSRSQTVNLTTPTPPANASTTAGARQAESRSADRNTSTSTSRVPFSRRVEQTATTRSLQEHRRLFRLNTGRPAAKKQCRMFSRHVVCLAGCDDCTVPTQEEKILLKANGIGEQCVNFQVDGDEQHVKEQITSAFEKKELEGGFEFLLPTKSSRTILDIVHSGPCNAEYLKVSCSRRIHIRPIQNNIFINEELRSPSSDVALKCTICGNYISARELREHVAECRAAQERASSVSFDIISDGESLPDPFSSETEMQQESEDKTSDVKQLLNILKEGFDKDSSISEIVIAFRELFLQGRTLNVQENLEDFVEGDVSDICISRFDVLTGAIDEFTSPTYNPRLTIKVDFMGEQGSDLGGPRKEFLRLALHEVLSRLFTSNYVELTNDEGHLRRKSYFAAGIIIGQCILQDGPPPNVLSARLVDMLLGDLSSDASVVQMRDGLKATGIIDLISNFPQCKGLLIATPATPLTARALIASFEAKFSDAGSNMRRKEEEMMGHFVRYLREVEAGQHWVNSHEGGEKVRLEHIIRFTTGLESKPVCGWHPPLTLTFTKHELDSMGIQASTCAHQLGLPLPKNTTDPLPSREVLFDLFNKSFPDEFFGKA